MNESYRKILKHYICTREMEQITKAMISIPSYSGIPNRETAVAEYLKSLLENEGIQTRLDPLPEGRSNLYAFLGDPGDCALMLTGHMDTIPPYTMQGALKPYVDEEGCIHGRGAADMKGGLAAMVGALYAIKRSGLKLQRGLLFAAVADVEDASLGTTVLLENGITAAAAIIGEPTNMNICISQKGLEWFEFHFSGKTVHSGEQQNGINAISQAVKFINAVENEIAPVLARRYHRKMGSPSVNVCTIKGGTQLSTVPGECIVQVDRRFLPEETYEGIINEFKVLLSRLAAEDKNFRCEMKIPDSCIMHKGYVHQGMELPEGHFLSAELQTALKEASGRESQLAACPFWTDAGLLSHYGNIPTVVFGPGDVSCGRSDGEKISLSTIKEAALTYALAVTRICGVEKA